MARESLALGILVHMEWEFQVGRCKCAYTHSSLVGKLALYCAAGGIAPHRVLPVVLDVGCDNKELRESSEYLGLPNPRLDGDEYYDFIEEFMQVAWTLTLMFLTLHQAVFDRWPDVTVQFEDFSSVKV